MEIPDSPAAAISMTQPATRFLVSRSANHYGIEFTDFRLRDMDSGEVLVNVPKEVRQMLNEKQEEEAKAWGMNDSMDDDSRVI